MRWGGDEIYFGEFKSSIRVGPGGLPCIPQYGIENEGSSIARGHIRWTKIGSAI